MKRQAAPLPVTPGSRPTPMKQWGGGGGALERFAHINVACVGGGGGGNSHAVLK